MGSEVAPSIWPGGAVFYCSLVDLCIGALVRYVQENIEPETYRGTLEGWDCAFQLSNELSAKILDTLPQELVQAFTEHVHLKSPRSGLIIASRASNLLVASDKNYWTLHNPVLSVPMETYTRVASNCAEGLTHVDLSRLNITDDVIEALSISAAAKTIESINVSQSRLSDALAPVWERFICLQTLNLENSDYLSSPTFEAIATHPTLSSLTFSGGRARPLRLLDILLAPKALPSLASLVLSAREEGCVTVLTKLVDLLYLRGNTERLELLNMMLLATDAADVFPLVYKIHMMCPNLKQMVVGSAPTQPLQANLSFAKSLSSVEFCNVESYFSFEASDVEYLPVLFPKLKWLSLTCLGPFDRWDTFQHVQYLLLRVSNLTCLKHLPSQLLHLSITAGSALPPGSDTEFETLCKDICEKSTELTALTLVLRHDNLISKRHVIRFLLSLQKLTTIRLRNSSKPAQIERFEIVHPQLREIPHFDFVGLDAVPLWMPRIEDAVFGSDTLDPLSPHRLPGLSSVVFPLLDADDDDTYHRLTQTMCQFGDRIRAAEFHNVPLNRVDQALLAIDMKYLVDLQLRTPDPIPRRVLQDNLKQLPRLASLNMNVVWDTHELEWLVHPYLARVTLALEIPSERAESRIDVEGHNLPLLSVLSLVLDGAKSETLTIQCHSCHRLVKFEMNNVTNKRWKLRLLAQSCPGLKDVIVRKFCIEKFQLLDLKGLLALSLDNVELLEQEGVLGPFECPSLLRCKVSATVVSAPRWSKWLEALKQQAHDPENLNFSWSLAQD